MWRSVLKLNYHLETDSLYIDLAGISMTFACLDN